MTNMSLTKMSMTKDEAGGEAYDKPHRDIRSEYRSEYRRDAALYLIPIPLCDDDKIEMRTLPLYNSEVILRIKYFIVESKKSAKRFFARLNKESAELSARATDADAGERGTGAEARQTSFSVHGTQSDGELPSHATDKIPIDDLTFFELNEHTDLRTVGDYLKPLENGCDMGILTDAGCPCIADPGAFIVEAAHKKNLRVVPLVGPSSVLLSLMASGLNGQRFRFCGYLPLKPHERKSKLRELETAVYKNDETQIFIEAPYRNVQMFSSILESCKSQTKLCVAANLTGRSEFIKTQTIEKWRREKIPDIHKVPAIFLIGK